MRFYELDGLIGLKYTNRPGPGIKANNQTV